MIQEPMLACESFTPEDGKYPYLGTPKIDGIRFYTDSNHVWTRSGRSMPNLPIQHQLKQLLPDGIDGELFSRNFRETQSLCMGISTSLDTFDCIVYMFDYMTDLVPKTGYLDRVNNLRSVLVSLKEKGWTKAEKEGLCQIWRHRLFNVGICMLTPVWLTTPMELSQYYKQALASGHEGIIVRSAEGLYKFGRATASENTMFKFKPTIDNKAIIIGVEEMMHNVNPAELDTFGRTKRSAAAAGLRPAGSLGAFVVRDLQTGVSFSVGGGPNLTAIERRRLWDNRHIIIGQEIEYRCVPYAVGDKPRHPQYLGLVSERSM